MNAFEATKYLDRVRTLGEGKWSARCPAHDDSRNSLSIQVGDYVPLILWCHAGCSFDEVLREIKARAFGVGDGR